MKKHLITTWLMLVFSFCILIAQTGNVRLKVSVRTSDDNTIPTAYLRVFTQVEGAATDSMFTDEQGLVDRYLPFNYPKDPFSVFSPRETGFIIKKIDPNIISRNTPQLKLNYSYPFDASLFFMDIQGRLYPNHTELSNGLYFYFIRFEDGNQSELHKIVVAEKTMLSVELVNILIKNDKRKVHSGLNNEFERFHIEILKDGFISLRDTITIDSVLLERTYRMEAAAIPTANFTFSGNLEVGSPVVFNASSSAGAVGEPLDYSWDFGDGKRGGNVQIPHLYSFPGEYNVTLTVTGKYRAKHSITQSFIIQKGASTEIYSGKIYGFITDENLTDLSDVKVSLVEGNETGYTDAKGTVLLSGLPVGIPIHLKLIKEGYVNQIIKITIPDETKDAHFFSTVKSRKSALNLPNAEFGGKLEGVDGTVVILPIEALVKPDGSPVRGNVDTYITPVDVAFETAAFPGTFQAFREDGESGVLLSYGVSEFHFGQNNEVLQLAPGKKATVLIPIYTNGAIPGDQIPLWSINEDNGIWVQEGMGMVVESENSPTGLVMKAEVSHLSWWNCDDFDDDRKRDGSCYRWECTSAICVKEKVGCWMSGAIRESGSKKNFTKGSRNKSMVDERISIPPVFEVRDFVPENGARLIMPYSRDVYIEARSIDNEGRFYEGNFTLLASQESDSFEIELQAVITNDTITLPLNTLYKGYLQAGEHIPFRVNIPRKNVFKLDFRGGPETPLKGVFMVRDFTGIISTGDINQINYFTSWPGQITIIISGLNQVDKGNFSIEISEADVIPIALNDSIYDSIATNVETRIYKIESNKNTLLRARFYYIESSGGTRQLKIYSSSTRVIGSSNFYPQETMLLVPMMKDFAYFIEMSGTSETVYVLIAEEDEQYNISYGDTVVNSLKYKKDKNLHHFTGRKGDLVSIRGSQPDYQLYKGSFNLLAEDGTEIARRSISANNRNNDYEILYKLPMDGRYSILVESAEDYAGAYQIIIDTVAYQYLNFDALTEINVSGNQSYYFELELTEDRISHLSVISDGGTGTFALWSEQCERINLLTSSRYYSSIYGANYTGHLKTGRYYLKLETESASRVFINFAGATPLNFNSKGETSFTDTIVEAKKINTYYFSGGLGDGIHGIIKKVDGLSIPGNIQLKYYLSYGDGSPLNVNWHILDHNSLDSNILNESGGSMTGTRDESTLIIVTYAETPGVYNFRFHHVRSSANIIVDDDFIQYPDAQTSSIIAAGYAMKESGKLFIANGEYTSYLSLAISRNLVTIEGQEKDNVLLRNISNTNDNPAISYMAKGGGIRNLSISCGNLNYWSMKVYGDNITLENLEIKPLAGRDIVSGGIKGSGKNMVLRNIFLNNSMWGVEIGSDNGVIENCELITENQALSLVGENTLVRNNTIVVKKSNRAIAVQSGLGTGNQIVENNMITINFANNMGDNGVIAIEKSGTSANATISFIRNNTVYNSTGSPGIYAGIGNPPSAIIVENNRFFSTNAIGSKAIRLSSIRSSGSSSIIVRNNIFDGLKPLEAIEIYGLDGVKQNRRFAIYNNNFRITSTASKDSTNNFIRINTSYSNVTDTLNLYIANNIFEGNGFLYFAKCQYGFSFYSDYNIVHNFRKYLGLLGSIIGKAHDITSDPLIIDGELHVGAASPAINNGASPSLFEYIPEFDINGVTRPQGPNYDIGAYEKEE